VPGVYEISFSPPPARKSPYSSIYVPGPAPALVHGSPHVEAAAFTKKPSNRGNRSVNKDVIRSIPADREDTPKIQT
jgi:hypothetical protein